MPSISAVIVAQNEEATIKEVLSSLVDLVEEIILVDSGSCDATIDIARGFGVKLIHQDWLGYAGQKNFALSHASGDWLLSLDADEIITPSLAQEIRKAVSGRDGQLYEGFRIARLLFIGSRAIKYGGFYPDAQLRLFKQGSGKFNDRLVHESVQVKGPVKDLKSPLWHKAYESVEEFEQTLEKYARLSAQEFMKKNFHPFRTSFVNEILHPVWTFFFRYVLRQGFRDGLLGLRLNIIYANYVRHKITYLREALEEFKN